VRIRFDARQIPFIEAETDRDAAFALGMVHAHLRLGQMELMRRLARGILAELLGPSAVKVDHSLRSLGLDWAVPEMAAALPAETREWLESFAAGISAYQRRMRRPPLEFRILRIPLRDWSVEDVLALSRLAGADVNWLIWLDLLGIREAHAWRVVWGKVLDLGLASPPSFTPQGWETYLPRLLGQALRGGSNSFAAGSGGRACLASDPHLGPLLPNLWLLCGLRSPSYRFAGLMVPGLPFVALGRNPDIAWGGTNMYAASSDLVNVEELPPEAFSWRTEAIKVRGRPPEEIRIRTTACGPVISDAPFLARYRGPAIALRWMGHRASDEITAFLRAGRARDWEGFRAAFATYAVSGQNIVFADSSGRVGQLMAARIPRRERGLPPDLLVRPGANDAAWDSPASAPDLPSRLEEEGCVASANNLPAPVEFPVGYLFPPGDRFRRILALLGSVPCPDADFMKTVQSDVYSASCHRLRVLLSRRMEECGAPELGRGVARMLRSLAEWDGRYRARSRGAAAFQLVIHAFARPWLERGYGKTLAAWLLASEAFTRVLEEELSADPGPALREALLRGAREAYRRWRRTPAWGLLHRLRPAHPLRMLPGIGRFFVFGDAGTDGSSQTVMKSAHPVTGRPHAVTYGAVARHVADLSDPDSNDFALLGGQDGWLLSENSLDLWEEWKQGRYVRIPLREESVREAFPHVVELEPPSSG
jgi:penicillin amidase